MTFAGATSARFAALQAGAVDAAILTPPFNFHAQSAGFNNLGNTIEYADMPFAGIAVNTNWAEANKATLAEKLVGVYNQSIAWLYDTEQPRRGRADSDQGQQAQSGRRARRAYDYLIGR